MDDKKKLPPIDTLTLIAKYKSTGWDIARIAKKMGMTEAGVGAVLKDLEVLQEGRPAVDALAAQYTLMAHQYQILGESLKLVAMALGNSMTASEIRELISANPDETVRNLLSKAIILRPYYFQDPAASLEKHLLQSNKGN